MITFIISTTVMFFMLKLDLFQKKSHHKKEISDHFDGKKFHNTWPDSRKLKDLFKWFIFRKRIPWPKSRTLHHQAKPETRVSKGVLKVWHVNHSTVLIQWNGLNILTDPIWSSRCGPLGKIGPKRVHPPGIAFVDLPPIDIVLLSHNHYDHMDIPTLKKLQKSHDFIILTGMGVGKILNKHKIYRVVEFDWWQENLLDCGLSATYVPAQHFSARGVLDRDRTLWGGFALKMNDEVIYFAGDTGYGNHFKEIRKRVGSPRLALLPIGTYEPRWFMKLAHMCPVEALKAHLELQAKTSMGIHFGTFHLSDEGIDDPPNVLRKEMIAQHIPIDSFWALEPGEMRNVP